MLQAQETDDWRNNPELANYLSLSSGARIHSFSSTDSADKFFVTNIIDPNNGYEGLWRTGLKKKPPQWVIIELPEPRMLTTFMVNTGHTNEQDYQGVSARVLKVEFSMVSPKEGFRKVGREYLRKNKNLQLVSVEAAKAQWVRLTIEGNWDFPFFAELGRVYAYNDVVMNRYESALMMDGTLSLSNIHFELNSSKLQERSLPIIESVAIALHNHPEWAIEIEGHTDQTGTKEANLKLSEERAQAVAQALIMVGIDSSRIKTVGYGATKPIEGEQGLSSANRRVVFNLQKETDE